MLKIGVIGAGYLGQHHARIFSELAGESDNVILAAVIDTNGKQAEEIAGKYGCAAYSDYREALDKADAFSIVTPTITHYAIAMDCIRAGKDILVEKPITSTIEEADKLITASQEAGVVVQIGHLERFNPAVAAIYPLLDSPAFIEAERLSPFQGRGIDVDITLDLMIHDIDIVFSILENSAVSDIKAAGARVLTDNIDIAKAWLDFNGLHALFTASRVSSEKSRKLTIFQHDSYLVLDYQNMEIKKFSGKGDKILCDTIKAEKKEPLKEELLDFIGCVMKRSRPKVCAIKGRNALDVALRIGKQIKQRWSD